MIRLLLFTLLVFSAAGFSQSERFDPLTIGQYRIGDQHFAVDLRDYAFHRSGKLGSKLRFVPGTMRWIRHEKVLLLPRALVEITIPAHRQENYQILYAGEATYPVFDARRKSLRAEIYVSLFEPSPIQIFGEQGLVEEVRVQSHQRGNRSGQLVDYSCAPFNLRITAPEDLLMSAGCRADRTGDFGQEFMRVEVVMSLANYQVAGSASSLHRMVFSRSGEGSMHLIAPDGKRRKLSLRIDAPGRLHSLKLAAGFGAYQLNTSARAREEREVVPTGMLYMNFRLNDASSIRGFDSYSQGRATYHNWGLYYAWDIVRFYDERFLLTSMLGLQGVEARLGSAHGTRGQVIFPQGFELTLDHAFGMLNHKLTYGMFSGLNVPYHYQNVWLRFGKKFFWELNYIDWERGLRRSQLYGVSIGFPVGSFF